MTALPTPRIVLDIKARLRVMLDKARTIKTETTVEPILSTAELDVDLKHLTDTDERFNRQTRDEAVECAARTILYRFIATTSFDDPEFVQVWNLLDIVQAAAAHDQAHVVLFMLLIEELLDTQTLAGCRRVFAYLEGRREKIVAAVFAKNKLILLRTCNELLRRLSKSEDSVFAGRIYIFLFQSYPLGDKSSVNLRGEFHTENVTSWESVAALKNDIEQGDNDGSGDVEMVDNAPSDDKTRPTPGITTTDTLGKTSVKKEESVDDIEPMALYPIFWALQTAFSNPPSLFSDAALAEFKNGLEMTIKKFKTIRHPTPKSISGRSGSAREAQGMSLKRKADGDPLEDGDMSGQERQPPSNHFEVFNPKYLTTPSLFELELADLTFHRHISVQALITLDFLLSLTPKAKAQMAPFKPQRAVAYPYTLSPENEAWAISMRRQIESYLLRHTDGASYSRMVEHVLARDKGWVRWKAQNCPPIERPPITTDSMIDARRNVKARTTWKRLKSQPMGALDLGFLTDPLPIQPDGTVRPGAWKTPAEEEASRPTADQLISEVQGIDLDIEFELPRGEALAKQKEELEAREKEAKRPLREEREKLRAETQAYLRTKADLEARRAAKTWILMRQTARNNFGLLKEIDERKDVTLCSPAKQAERRARELEEAAKKSVEQAAADDAKESNDVPVGKDDGDEDAGVAAEQTNGDADMEKTEDAGAEDADAEHKTTTADAEDKMDVDTSAKDSAPGDADAGAAQPAEASDNPPA